jgi:hypothetical protein
MSRASSVTSLDAGEPWRGLFRQSENKGLPHMERLVSRKVYFLRRMRGCVSFHVSLGHCHIVL